MVFLQQEDPAAAPSFDDVRGFYTKMEAIEKHFQLFQQEWARQNADPLPESDVFDRVVFSEKDNTTLRAKDFGPAAAGGLQLPFSEIATFQLADSLFTGWNVSAVSCASPEEVPIPIVATRHNAARPSHTARYPREVRQRAEFCGKVPNVEASPRLDLVTEERPHAHPIFPRQRGKLAARCDAWRRAQIINERKKEKLIDYKITKQLQNRSMEYAPTFLGPTMSPLDAMQYKYLLVDRSGGCSTREFWTLQSNSLIFLLDSPLACWWDEVLVPWEHYVPLKSDFSDVYEKLEYFKKFDTQALAIVRNMQIQFRELMDQEYQIWFLHTMLLELARGGAAEVGADGKYVID